MKFKILTSLALLLILTVTANALTLDGSCSIRFFGESTLHNFDGKASCEPFELNSAGATDTIPQPVIKVLVSKMDTGNSGRDKKMYAMFEQQAYPEIQALFSDLDAELVLQKLHSDTGSPGAMDFDLLIRNVRQPVHALAKDLQVSPEQISYTLEFPLVLSSFQLQPPSVLGIIRVNDQIRVEVSVFLKRY